MESLKEKFNLTKNTLFDWSIIERKNNIDNIPKDITDIKTKEVNSRLDSDTKTKEVNSRLDSDTKKSIIDTNALKPKDIILENDSVSNSIKIEITDSKHDSKLTNLDNSLNINKILETESEDNIIHSLKVIESKNSKHGLHNVEKLNENLNKLIDTITNMTSTIDMLEKKINSLEETSKMKNQSDLLTQSYLGILNYPFYNFYLHNSRFDTNNDTSLTSLDEIENIK